MTRARSAPNSRRVPSSARDAPRRPRLSASELDHLRRGLRQRAKFSAVDLGDEVVLSFDGSGNLDSAPRRRRYSYQCHHGADMLELFGIDYSYKAVKTILSYKAQAMKTAQLNLIALLQYGAMPTWAGTPCPTAPSPTGRSSCRWQHRRGARRAGGGHRHAVTDMVFVAEGWEAGADGLDFDTAGGRRRRRLPGGPHRHRDIRAATPTRHRARHGRRVRAGHARRARVPGPAARRHVAAEQVKVAQEAGATMFGPAVNVNTTRSQAWNIARACTIISRAWLGRNPRAPQRRHGRRRRAMSPTPGRRRLACLAARSSTSCAATGCRSASATLGMACTHALASAWAACGWPETSSAAADDPGMRLEEARRTWPAARLAVADLADPIAMHDVRRDLGLGRVAVQELTYPTQRAAIEAKFRIADVSTCPSTA